VLVEVILVYSLRASNFSAINDRLEAAIDHALAVEWHEDVITRLVGALLLEQNDEWAVQRGRYMSLETIAPLSDDPIIKLPAVAV
jgi:hypothetical protein